MFFNLFYRLKIHAIRRIVVVDANVNHCLEQKNMLVIAVQKVCVYVCSFRGGYSRPVNLEFSKPGDLGLFHTEKQGDWAKTGRQPKFAKSINIIEKIVLGKYIASKIIINSRMNSTFIMTLSIRTFIERSSHVHKIKYIRTLYGKI